MNKKVELLKKLKALADRGVDGEKVAAEKMLDKLMKKYDVTDEELSADEVSTMVFKYSGAEQKKLLLQIIYKVTNKTDIFYDYINRDSGGVSRTRLGADVTKAQKIEIEFLFDFYVRQYEKECEVFLEAFIQKNQLFGNSLQADDEQVAKHKDLAKLYSMMNGIDKVSPLLQIETAKK